ncbi:MAG: ABC transporter substrate-binding protein [Deltaproteobacteria bacterium]|nr:ABC transporter substrate-binding protein [Deltaproteobacteria bacterium]
MGIKYLYHMSLLLFLTLTFVAPAMAGDPTNKIKQTTDKIIAILNDPVLKIPDKAAERRRMIHEEVDGLFDWEEFSRRALARHWRKRTDKEKKEFVPLFGKLVERTYMDKVENYSGERVLYTGEKIEGNYGVVNVKVMTNKNEEIDVDYRLKKRDDEWVVYDVSIAGVSLVNNYRVQFNNIIIRSSYKELMKRLREKVAKE